MDPRAQILVAVVAADPALPAARVAAAVDAVATNPAATRELSAALVADPHALSVGAPPVIGRLLAELRAAGSMLPEPGCARCGRSRPPVDPLRRRRGVRPLPAPSTRRSLHPLWGGQTRCRARRAAPSRLRPLRRPAPTPLRAGAAHRHPRQRHRTRHLRRLLPRPPRRLPELWAAAAVRVRGRGPPDLPGLPTADARGLRALRPASPALGSLARGPGLRPLLHCGAAPPRPLHDLRHHPAPVAPPGPDATTCLDCAHRAGLPTGHLRGHVCGDCGTEDKLYERGRCAPCALRRRTGELLMAGAEQLPAELTAL